MKGISQALKSTDEVKAVAAELQRNTRSNLFYCLWVFMYESGLRISDVLKLKYEDVEGFADIAGQTAILLDGTAQQFDAAFWLFIADNQAA